MTQTEQLHDFVLEELANQSFVSEVALSKAPDLKGYIAYAIIKALSQPYDSIGYPADWFQAFKQRWFPRWLLRHFPVTLTIWTAKRLAVQTWRLCHRRPMSNSWLKPRGKLPTPIKKGGE